MKTNIFIITTLFAIQTTWACAQQTLELTIKNIQTTQGTVRIALFNNEADFLKKPVKTKLVKADQTELKIVFEDLAVATYAVSVYHDVNDNDKMDSNFMGIPTEAYGFSNDARGTFGPPSFTKASFQIKPGRNEAAITIQ